MRVGAIGSSSWMSGLGIPRYGLLVRVSWSSSCHWPSYKVTARASWFLFAGGLNRRTSYPRLFLESSAVTNVILSLVDCANRGLLRATCMSSSQMCVLLVSLELAMVERSRVSCLILQSTSLSSTSCCRGRLPPSDLATDLGRQCSINSHLYCT